MADHRNQSNPSRNRDMDPSYDVYDEDPLVELARIVSEEGGYLNISEDNQTAAGTEADTTQASAAPETNYGRVEAEPVQDLENQLMEELEMSMALPAEELNEYSVRDAADGQYEEVIDQPHDTPLQDTFEPGGSQLVDDQGYVVDEDPEPAQFEADHFAPHPAQFEPEADQFNRQPEQFEPQPEQFELQAEQFEPQPEQFEPQPEQFEAQPEQFELQSEPFEPQPEQFEPQPEQFEPQLEQFEAQEDQFEHQQDQVAYASDSDGAMSGEVSELLSEQELSELEKALAEVDNPDDADAGGRFDDDLDQVVSVGYAEATDDIDDLDDDIYTVPPALPIDAGFEEAEGRRGSGRKIFAIAAVLSIAVLGGGVLAMLSSTSNNKVASAPPVFKAADSPLKVAPEAGSDVASDDNQPTFDIAATDSEPAKEELVERAEKPVDQVIARSETQQLEELRAGGAPDNKDMARLSADTDQVTPVDRTQPIGPKQVTTVKVSANGTIIRPSLDESGPTAQADEEPIIVGGLPEPVAQPDTGPTVSVEETQPVPVRVVEIKPTQPDTSAIGNNSVVANTTSPLTEVVSDLPAPGSTSAIDVTQGADNPLPRARPDEAPEIKVARVEPAPGLVAQPAPQRNSGPVNLLDSNSAAPRAAATPAAPRATSGTTAGSGYLVQLSAQRSENQALATFNGLKSRYPSLLGSYQPNIQRADLGDRGIYYRVRVGPMASQGAANEFCQQLKSSGGSCFVTR